MRKSYPKRKSRETHQLVEWQTDDGEWRWQIRSTANRKIVAESGEGYKRRGTMKRTFANLCRAFREGRIARHG